MENVKCKTCGGSVTRSGNYYVCEWCRNKWEVDQANDVHAVERANAWEALRNGDFEKATEMFENIIVKDNSNHEAYWGRALSRGGIIYVTDMNESKKVPTCNNITEESFVGSKDVQMAISLASADIADNYRKQAEYIEKVRIEWLEKASKEPAYDVFISFKDSDRENGIERTQDSVDAQDLYNALVADGYKVFFSRISLRDKISEQYEPYIYNAIKTAKVMIVFGEKAEYFSSVWIKNEWSRFKTRIEKGEKHKNSLVVVYKNMNPGDLPTVLKSRQCLNASDMTFLPSLNKHIKRVIEESKQALHLEKITVKSGEISKKATKIENESIQIREIGAGAIAEVSISEKQQMELAKTYVNMAQWYDAIKIVDDVIFDNPNNPDAILYSLLIKYRSKTVKELRTEMVSFSDEDFGTIEKTLNCESKEKAAKILNTLFTADEVVDEATYCKILKAILPYQFADRDKRISEDFNTAIEKKRFGVFNILLGTLDTGDVDQYIDYNLEFAKKTSNVEHKKKCLNAVLKVDSGNTEALKLLFTIQYEKCSNASELIKHLEEMLKYSKDVDETVEWVLDYTCAFHGYIAHPTFTKEALKYYTKPIENLKEILMKSSSNLVSSGHFEEAEELLGIILTFAPNEPEVYWLICLLKTESRNEKDLIRSPISIKEVPEYTKYLTLVDAERRNECIKLAIAQTKESERSAKAKADQIAREARAKEEKEAREAREAAAAIAAIERAKRQKRIKRVVIAISSAALTLVATILITVLWVLPSNNYKKAEQYFAEGNYLEAYKYYDKANGWKDSYSKIADIRSQASTEAEKLAAEGKYQEAYNYLSTAGTYSDKTLKEGYLAAAQGNYSEAAKKGVPYIIIPDGTTQISDFAFEACSELKRVIIPNSVTSIGNSAFLGCGLKEIIIPDSVTSIGNNAFSGCGLKEITIPDSVTNIGESAFVRCSNLTSITIPDSVISIGNNTFEGCKKLVSITIPDSITSIGNRMFYNCESLVSVTIGSDITNIGNNAFYGCLSLANVTLPDSLTTIGNEVFYNCESFTSIVIPDSVTSIGNRMFYNCKTLASVTIGNGVTSIGERAFFGCNGLTSVTIGKGVASIGVSAFEGCEVLMGITIPDNVTSIGDRAFYGCSNLEKITLPFVGLSPNATGSDMHFGAIFGCADVTYSSDEYHYSINGREYYYNIPKNLKYITINGEQIKDYVFARCDTLETVIIGENIKTIGQRAFSNCSNLKSVVIGNAVNDIQYGAFEYCSNLTDVILGKNLKSIGAFAFEYTNLKSIIIPKSVGVIEWDIFEGCQLLTIYCEAAQEPDEWSYAWNRISGFTGNNYAPVVWGYKIDEP